MAEKAKVFCVGFQKTGTTSMGAALEILGYRVTGGNWARDPEVARVALQRALETAPLYDAFQDNPWPLLYQEMDKAFPGSKFIMTIRPPEQWIKSAVKGFGAGTSPVREWIYGEGKGSPVGNEQTWLARYERHNREVLAYFAGRQDDFMVMDLAAGDGWEKLCRFLGQPVPDVPFPHANPAHKKFLKRTLKSIKRRLGFRV
jgi:hypothetical protein